MHFFKCPNFPLEPVLQNFLQLLLISYRNKLECSRFQALPAQPIMGGKGKEPFLRMEFQKELLSGRLQPCLHILA
jgi:hypothetical protein